MRFGSFEGTPEELKNVCENHGFDPSNFLKEPPKFKINIWTVRSLILLITLVSICIWTIELPVTTLRILTISDLVLILIITATIHLRYQRWELTILSLIGGLVILALCLNLITPQEAINELKDKALKKVGS